MPYDGNGDYVPMKAAYDAWAPLAVARLIEAARTYNSYVTYKQLSEYVQQQSGISHNALISNWIGELLGRVIDYCRKNRTPHLSSLCVTAEGTVGNGYRAVIEAEKSQDTDELHDADESACHGEIDEGSESCDQLDDHAAKTRLDCYRYFGASLPPGGGEPTLTPQAKAARDWKRAQAKLAEPPKVCPIHYVTLPVTGVCDLCQ